MNFTGRHSNSTSVDERGHGGPLLLGGPFGHEDVHGGEGQASAETHKDPHEDEILESGSGADGTEERGANVEDDSHEEDPLAAVELSHSTARNLGDEVAPEVGSQDQALVGLRP